MFTKGAMWTDFTPNSGDTINVPVSDAGTPMNVCINNAGLLAALTLVFPITGVQDGQIVKVAAKSAITLLTTNVESGGLLQGLLASLLAGGNGIYQYRLSNKTWYKFSA